MDPRRLEQIPYEDFTFSFEGTTLQVTVPSFLLNGVNYKEEAKIPVAHYEDQNDMGFVMRLIVPVTFAIVVQSAGNWFTDRYRSLSDAAETKFLRILKPHVERHVAENPDLGYQGYHAKLKAEANAVARSIKHAERNIERNKEHIKSFTDEIVKFEAESALALERYEEIKQEIGIVVKIFPGALDQLRASYNPMTLIDNFNDEVQISRTDFIDDDIDNINSETETFTTTGIAVLLEREES